MTPTDDPDAEVRAPEEARKVLISVEAFELLATRDEHGNRLRVEWGKPDRDGFYTPTVFVERAD